MGISGTLPTMLRHAISRARNRVSERQREESLAAMNPSLLNAACLNTPAHRQWGATREAELDVYREEFGKRRNNSAPAHAGVISS